METISGADIRENPQVIQPNVIPHLSKRRGKAINRVAKMEPYRPLLVFPAGWQSNRAYCRAGGENHMSIGTIILIILVIALLGGFSGIGGGPFYGTGYYGGGGLGLVIVILLILLLMGRL
jgi:hypothetical protein